MNSKTAEVLSVKDLTFRFPSEEGPVIDGVSFEIRAGELVSLVGASGSGKTTLLSLLAGFADPTAGSIRNPFGNPAMVFQRGALFDWLTIRGNVEFPLRRQGIGEPELNRRALSLVEKVGLTDYCETFPHRLSGGMRRRLELARAWASPAALLLLDEALVGVDYPSRCSLQILLEELWRTEGRTILSVTHDPEEACFLGDRVLILRSDRDLEEIPIEFPRPRDNSLRYESTFVEIRKRVACL